MKPLHTNSISPVLPSPPALRCKSYSFPSIKSVMLISVLLSFCLCSSAISGAAQNVQGVTLHTVVIDPGHGGADPGTVAPGGKIYEKRIALSVALKLGKLIEKAYPDVNVLYTRSADVFLPLATRSDFANKNHADLFISIHANGFEKTGPSGSETYVMGMNSSDSNMELIKSENSVIAYEEDYNTTYQGFDPYNPESYIIFSLVQNAHLEQSVHFAQLVQSALGRNPITVNRGVKQGGLVVLWGSAMPSVLVELGFLSNAKDRAVLTSEDGQQKLASALFKAFQQYKTAYDGPYLSSQGNTEGADISGATSSSTSGATSSSTSGAAASSTSGAKPSSTSGAAPTPSSPVYRVQIIAVGKLLPSNAPDFKGYTDIRSKKVGNLYKYTTGSFATKQEAQTFCNKVRKDFPGAFVVEE